MAKKKLAQAGPTQLLLEKILGIAALLLVFYHMLLSFSRHFFAPENDLHASPICMTLLAIDRWYALALLLCFLAYLAFSKACCPATWYRITDAFKRCVCKESAILFLLFLYYLFALVSQSGQYKRVFKSNDFYLLDFAISCFVLLPMANLVGYKKMRKMMAVPLHAIMLLSTGFILWALWHLFHLHLVDLPNGLQIGMTDFYTLYLGVNQNIGAAIGTTMIIIALYMAVSHRGIVRILYSIGIIPHVYATLMTGSRGNFFALMIGLSLIAIVIVWRKASAWEKRRRVTAACIAGLATAGIVWWLRAGVYTIFDSVTHLSQYLNISPTARNLVYDTGRLPIWRASIHILFSSSQAFFFGIPSSTIPETLQSTMIQLLGSGSLKAHAHNMILQTGLTSGVPGMIAFTAFWVMMAIRCVKVGLAKENPGCPGAFILPVGVLMMVIVNLFEPFLLFYFSVMGCLFFLFCGWVIAIDSHHS